MNSFSIDLIIYCSLDFYREKKMSTQGSSTKNSVSANTSRTRRTKRSRADKTTVRIGFVGAGKLASAIITGLVVHPRDNPNEKPIDPKRIYVSAPTTINTDQLKITFPGIRITKRNIDIFGRFDCDIVFICVPPTVIRNLYKIGGTRPAALTTNYIPNMRHPVYVMSLVFGFSNDQIKECLLNPENPERYTVKFYRTVISHSIAYGVGNCWVDAEPDSKNFPELVRDILCRICRVEYLPENQMDSVCTISGAGLAFVSTFIFDDALIF